MTQKKYQLISFKLCPYVQRSVITLNEKKVPFDIKYIDLENKPDWFLKLSPTGRVPVLQVGDDVLFESAVINEYLDEVNPPSLHPADPIKKAVNRAFTEMASGVLSLMYQQALATTEAEFKQLTLEIQTSLKKLDDQVVLPFFNGPDFNLVDTSIAPIFGRISYLADSVPFDYYEGCTRLKTYAQNLAERESVKNSVLPEVPKEYRESVKKRGGFMAQWF